MNEKRLESARVESAAHLRTIGNALLVFVGGIGPAWRERAGRVPSSLDEVVSELDLSPSLLRSPLEGVEYVLTGAPVLGTSDTVIAYEKGARGVVNVLYGDGHVEPLTEEQAGAAIGRSTP